MECTVSNRKLVTLSSAVRASIIDKWEDLGKVQQRYNHWASREYRQLYNQILPKLPQKVLLQVNPNTHTATLPLDFAGETFIGGINEHWQKVPLRLNNDIVDSKNVSEIPCEDACPKCQQDTGICNDLVVTEETNTLVINGAPYEQTIVKKLYPNGDYYLETSTPVLSIDDDEVDYAVKKEFITNFDLKPCGCLDTTPANIVTLKTHCPDIYCNYYSGSCSTPCNTAYAGYRIFEESGLIQFDVNFPYSKVYMEYNGYIQKIKGQYFIPEVAFECVVEGIKKRAIKDRANVPNWQIFNQKEDYKIAKRDLQRILGRVSLNQIVQAINTLPKFDYDHPNDWYRNFCYDNSVTGISSSSLSGASGGSIGGGSGNGTTVINNNTYVNGTFVLSVKADGTTGKPMPGSSIYQNNLLKGITSMGWIFLAKQTLTESDNDYTLDVVTGELDISPNVFVTDDSLIIPYNKIVI